MRSLFVVLIFAGCIPPPPVYRVQRSARVPRPTAPLRTGEPLGGFVEASFGATSLAETRDPRLAADDAAVEVPSQQVRGELRFRLGRRAELALFEENAIDDSLHAVEPTQAPVEEGTPWGIGAAMRYSFTIPRAPALSIGTGLELMHWSIPYVEYRTCIENCDGVPTMQVLRGTSGLPAFGFTLTPTYRVGPVALFASVAARPHPTIVRKGTELYPEDTEESESDVGMGALNWIVQGGAEYRYMNLSLLAAVQYVVTRDPVSYAPSLALSLSLFLPD